jgi:hypothetical protein
VHTPAEMRLARPAVSASRLLTAEHRGRLRLWPRPAAAAATSAAAAAAAAARPAAWLGAAAAATAGGCCAAAACESKPGVLGKVDLTGDGVAETTAYDTVGDGKVDALDTSGDGQVDTVLVDLYRDTPLRYMGYSNEVGEAFRPIIPRLVVPSYALAIVYVLADTVDKGRQAHELSVATSGAADTRRVLEQAGDCLVWQLLASVFVPGAVIHQVVHFLGRGIKATPSMPPMGAWRELLVPHRHSHRHSQPQLMGMYLFCTHRFRLRTCR